MSKVNSLNTNILFTDDEESIREAYKTILTPSKRRSSRRAKGSDAKVDYNLFFAESGEKAVEIYREQFEKGDPIGVGFFDMIMPGGIDGTETIRQISEIDDRIMCVVATAYADRDPREMTKFFSDQSMWLYLNKPFNDGEIRQLAANLTHGWTLRKEIKEYNENLENLVIQRTKELNDELEKVTIIQKNLLPQRLPQYENIDLSVYYNTCLDDGGGGDYYDVVQISEDVLGILVADASGHGPSAAVIMAITCAMFRNLLRDSPGLSPGQILEKLNHNLDGNYPRGNFVTMFYGELNVKTGKFVTVNAAHPWPVYGQGKDFKLLKAKTGSILGMFPSEYPETTITLNDGDYLMLFTDGIEEHKNADREEFGFDRILDVFKKNNTVDSGTMIQKLIAAADEFRPNLSREDDFTFVSLIWNKPKS